MSKQKPQPFKTPKATITPQQLARIRTAARQYLLAGGGIVVTTLDHGLDEHIANTRELLTTGSTDRFEAVLTKHLTEHLAHEAVWSEAWCLVAAEGEAGFAFGVAVGCEVAALTLGLTGGER